MPAKSAPAAPPEAIATVAQHTVAKLSERATGRLAYQIGVGASGVVYLSVTDNEGGGYFSKEPVPLHKIQTVLANPLATGEPFATSLLRRAFVSRSNNNGCFLAAVLRHEGLLKPADTPNQHVCAGTGTRGPTTSGTVWRRRVRTRGRSRLRRCRSPSRSRRRMPRDRSSPMPRSRRYWDWPSPKGPAWRENPRTRTGRRRPRTPGAIRLQRRERAPSRRPGVRGAAAMQTVERLS
jgi:hypothetical protein